MTSRRGWMLLVVACAPLACTTLAVADEPALIAAPNERSRAELLRVVTAAVNGQAVLLADDALTRDSVLVVERRPPRTLAGSAATGRTLEAPEQFRLVLRESRCVLVRASDGHEWPLRDVQCVPAPR